MQILRGDTQIDVDLAKWCGGEQEKLPPRQWGDRIAILKLPKDENALVGLVVFSEAQRLAVHRHL